MARNMIKIIENCKMNQLYEMNSSEIQELYRYVVWNRGVEAIMLSFQYGYALGQRALKSELKQKERQKE